MPTTSSLRFALIALAAVFVCPTSAMAGLIELEAQPVTDRQTIELGQARFTFRINDDSARVLIGHTSSKARTLSVGKGLFETFERRAWVGVVPSPSIESGKMSQILYARDVSGLEIDDDFIPIARGLPNEAVLYQHPTPGVDPLGNEGPLANVGDRVTLGFVVGTRQYTHFSDGIAARVLVNNVQYGYLSLERGSVSILGGGLSGAPITAPSVAAVPEPSSLWLAGGLGMVLLVGRRRKRAA